MSDTLQVQRTERGFEYVLLPDGTKLQQSSAIGDYENSWQLPGSSYLWHGDDHLSREEVKDWLESDSIDPMFVPHARAWLETGSLNV